MYNTPKNFILKIQCLDCEEIEEIECNDGIECIDKWISCHIEINGHKKYQLEMSDFKSDTFEEIERSDRDDIVNIFDDIDNALALSDIIAELKKLKYENPGGSIKKAIDDDILYVDDIESDGTVYIALSSIGEMIWEYQNSDG